MAAHASLYRTESRWGLYHLRTDYPEKNNEDWFCHTLLRKQDGRMVSEKRAVQPYVVPIADDEKDLYDKQRIRATRLTLDFSRRKQGLSHATCQHQTTVPVVVDDAKCIADKGCTVCVDVCPLDVLRISDMTGKAYMAYDECWYCMPCEADCPTGAVKVNIPYLLR